MMKLISTVTPARFAEEAARVVERVTRAARSVKIGTLARCYEDGREKFECAIA